MDRRSSDYNKSFQFTGTYTETLNLSLYNYLGFAQSEGPCADAVEGYSRIRNQFSKFESRCRYIRLDRRSRARNCCIRREARCYGIFDGFQYKCYLVSSIGWKGCLVISDELNHASIRIGARLSGAVIKSYKHNVMQDLERLLRESTSQGQPDSHHPWRKVFVVVEGLFSMEGTIADLPSLLRLKKKYKFYLVVDEAHSIGALGYVNLHLSGLPSRTIRIRS
jgi:serine palmitoyltransferase